MTKHLNMMSAALIIALCLVGCGQDEMAIHHAASNSSISPIAALPPTHHAPLANPVQVWNDNPDAPPTEPDEPLIPEQSTDGKIVVVTEGSSSAITWGGNHTGMYRDSRDDIEFHGLAIGGSGIFRLTDRIDNVLTVKPDLVSIYIGSNDLSSFPTTEAFVVELKKYVDAIRADGARVVVCTLLAHQLGIPDDARYNAMRKEFGEIMRQADWVDGIADFEADPVMGTDEAPLNPELFKDGVHPTDGANFAHGVPGNVESGQKKLFKIFQPVMDSLAEDIR